MFVNFDNRLHYVLREYSLETPAQNVKGKKRKISQEIYILVDCTSDMTKEIAVNANDCQRSEVKMPYEFQTYFDRYIKGLQEGRLVHIKFSYEGGKSDYYVISRFISINSDHIIVETRDDEIKHFKYDKIYFSCVDGICKSRSYDDNDEDFAEC